MNTNKKETAPKEIYSKYLVFKNPLTGLSAILTLTSMDSSTTQRASAMLLRELELSV